MIEELELLNIWMDRYITFIINKDQIKYSPFSYKHINYLYGIENFDQLKRALKYKQ